MKETLQNKQLRYLFLCNFAIVFIGFGLFPVLPLYSAELGASPSFIGIFLGITYIAISLGTIITAQLSERLSYKTLYIAAGLLGAISMLLLGMVNTLWQVVLLTALVWFSGGVGLSVSSILTTMHTSSSERGKAFGLLALTSPLGALIGSLVVGRLVTWSGYPLMFIVLAVVWTMFPLLAMTKVKYEPTYDSSPAKTAQTKSTAPQPGFHFLLLLTTVLLASMAVSVGRMGLSMSMKDQMFSAADVSTANAFGGLFTIPVTLMISGLSDKLGRKRFLFMGYVLAMGSTVLLIAAQELWQFWIVAALVLASRSVITSMSPAYATDLLSSESLGKTLPLVSTMNWVSGVVGFTGSGYVIDTFGSTSLYGGTTVIAVLAGILVMFLPVSLNKIIPTPPPDEIKEALPDICKYC
ncbi:MAG TPA: MFS transporter [Anaerolineales bacterium]|nr:MFS transporter [Anaerolineales bacterium]